MNGKIWIVTGTITTVAVATIVWATTNTRTFRTAARLVTVAQGTDEVNGNPEYDFGSLTGHDLVNLALGTELGTRRTNEVLALEIDCESSVASLVVYDKTADSNIVTIATTSALDVVEQQGRDAAPFPNRERFVGLFEVLTSGNATTGFAGGYLTIAGRLHLDPQTGCPRAVPTELDKDPLDKLLGDRDFKESDTDDEFRVRLRAGHAHGIGVLDVVTGGVTNAVLVPGLQVSVRRQLAQ